MSDIKLKHCPFCGGEAHLTKKNRIIVDGQTERECHVHCTRCNARAERVLYKSCETTEMAHELAKEMWNTRKPMKRIEEELETWMEESYKGNYDCMTGEPCNNPCVDCAADKIRKAIEIVRKAGAE